jgi:hypothetical protein
MSDVYADKKMRDAAHNILAIPCDLDELLQYCKTRCYGVSRQVFLAETATQSSRLQLLQ